MNKQEKEQLEKFRRYLVRQNFNGAYGHLKKNILGRFDEMKSAFNHPSVNGSKEWMNLL